MKTKLFYLILLFTLHSSPITVFGAFKDYGWGVRPSSLGGSFVAVSDDSNSPLYNSAGAANVSGKEVTFMSSRLFVGLENVNIGINYFSYVQNISDDFGGFGITWASLYSAALYREDTLALSYARSLKDLFGFYTNDLIIGTNAKYLRHEYELDIRSVSNPVFADGTSKDAVSADAGILFSWVDTGLSFGFSSKNINRPDVGLKSPDIVENENVAGIAYFNENIPYLSIPNFTLTCDFSKRGEVSQFRAGLESLLIDKSFAVRVGGNDQELTLGLGYALDIWRKDKLSIDYGFSWPIEVKETSGTHRMGLTLKFN